MPLQSWLLSMALAGVLLVAGDATSQAQQTEPAGPAKQAETDRIEAIKKLCMAKDPKSVGTIRAALKDESAMVRRIAVYALERLRDPAAAADIIPLLQDADPWVRRTAAVALSKVGGNQGASAIVAVAVKDADIYVRYDALLSLARLSDAGTQGQAFAAMQDRRIWSELSAHEQESLVEMLGEPWITDPGVQSFLQKLLKKGQEPDPELDKLDAARRASTVRIVTESAAAVLAQRFADSTGEELLLQAAGRRDDDFLLQKATRALGAIKSKKAVPVLVAALDGNARGEKWLNTSRYVLEALGAIGGPEAVQALEKALVHDDYRIRRTAADALFKIDGRKRDAVAPDGPAAAIPPVPEGTLPAPGGKRPPQFILLGVDDCTNIEGLESLVNICETLREEDSRAVFTMWLAPLAGSSIHNDLEKRKVLYQHLFDMGCEIAHHTLHHNPGGKNWSSLPREIQIEEIEGCTKWYQANIQGFARPFTFKGGGGGQGAAADRAFTLELLGRQNFLYSGRRVAHPNQFAWPRADQVPMGIPCSPLDAGAAPVHEKITNPIYSDYPGRFDFDVGAGVAMWKANLDFRYKHPLRPPLVVNAFHDWAVRDVVDKAGQRSHRNEGKILKAFLLDVLVKNKDKYPETYCITFRQFMEYVRTDGDLKQTLAIGNGQDTRNPAKPSIK